MRFIGIDPSTKTGFVALDAEGNVLRAKELTGIGDKDPKRITTLIQEVISHIQPNDHVAIEGFSYNSQGRGVGFQFGIGYGMRIALYSRNRSYREVTPGQLKKFATGKGNTSKADMAQPILETWGYSHPSDNVLDAYVLAQIARAIAQKDKLTLTEYQQEVIETILNPTKPKKKARKKHGA
ncbi:RuvC family protein [Halalkalibacterium halodurans]|uniref:hypothetical protein n=1 Tax=Halalkalibacterium halodurans TaxID=86665 RepID=UPI002AA9C58F|nr:hypothetical protein [Halalkalibacterium halodurans]MDY7222116.1 hypothetical protein [Halalkalibacterium halodurans]MDY7243926.1 hypothetical protein [Halalkalibacterium halodurans]